MLMTYRTTAAALFPFIILAANQAYAAIAQKTCPETWSSTIAVDIGSFEFDKDLRSGNFTRYGLNENFAWRMYPNSNVRWMNPHLQNWNTEAGVDRMRLNDTYEFSGNQGTRWWGTKYGTSGGYYKFQWTSDGSTNFDGYARFDLMRFQCDPPDQQTTVAPIRAIGTNTRYDSVFFTSAGDVAYFSVTQPAQKELRITVDLNVMNGTWADFDIVASTTTTRPDYVDNQWFATVGGGQTAGLAGEVLYIPPAGTSRTVYFGVTNWSGLGHVSIRANEFFTTWIQLCTQGMTSAQLAADPGWPRMRETLQRTVLRLFQTTHGNLWPTVFIKQPSAPGDTYCSGDASCDLCMNPWSWCTGCNGGQPPKPAAVPAGDGCGYQTGATGRVRIPNVACQGVWDGINPRGADPQHGVDSYDNPQLMSKVLMHELGHGLGRLLTHSDVGTLLADHYTSTGPQTAHSIMNSPTRAWDGVTGDAWFHTAYRFSTDLNHCKPNDPVVSPSCTQTLSDWRVIQNSGYAPTWIYPDHAYSSQPWVALEQNVRAQSKVGFVFE